MAKLITIKKVEGGLEDDMIINEVKEVQPKDGKRFSLQELYDLLECTCVQVIPLNDGLEMWIDEEGKLKNEDYWLVNNIATQEWEKVYGKTDIIVGNALITPYVPDEEEDINS